MATVLWIPQINALTTPLSYRIQYVPRNTVGYSEMAADIAAAHPNYNAELILSLAPMIMEWIQERLSNGDQVTLKNALNFRLSFTGRLDRPDAPLPGNKELLHVRVTPSRPFVRKIRRTARLERLPMHEKLPRITSCQDTGLKLKNVLTPDTILRLIGSDLSFDQDDPDSGCVIRGTRSGAIRQSAYGPITDKDVLLIPHIPPQDDPWNNEYLLSLHTRYTAHGTPRTGIYRSRLRTPLDVPGLGLPDPPETGILTGSSATPYVTVTGGTISADERLRIQAVLDMREDRLLLSLLDMQEEGVSGPEISVTANGEYTLEGFSGSAVSSLNITVQEYTALKEMIRNDYSGRLVDVLDVKRA